jgi:phosphate uptake regulator
MIPFEGLHENFRFIALETLNLVNATYEWMKNPSPAGHDRIKARDDYVDNLKNTIENQCYTIINTHKDLRNEEISEIRGIQISAVNIERIADNCINILGQVAHLRDPAVLENYNHVECFSVISNTMAGVADAFENRSLSDALAICRAEPELDRLYKIYFDRIMAEMNAGGDAQTLLTVLFIFRYFERMGDTLLNIGEALIFSILGQKIKIHQFEALRQNMEESGFDTSMEDTDMEAILGTRSGCRVSRVEQGAVKKRRQDGIFKEGNAFKLRAEKASLDRWATLVPGLAPSVLSFRETGETAGMLVQFLPGHTFDEVLLNADDTLLARATGALTGTVRHVWETTRRDTPVCTDYVHQIPARLKDVRKIYPDFFRDAQAIGDAHSASSQELLDICTDIQEQLTAPFSVLAHGDFNVNNIVYNPDANSVHYIDMHRSDYADYIQDMSVLLISHFRIPVFKTRFRRRLNMQIHSLYSFAADMAHAWDDRTFDARMALALTRSFYTSTRFELNEIFARAMFLRAHFLMEKIAGHTHCGRDWSSFKLPEAVLYY